ncbi:MAG: zf-HC2 domain-containing protein [Candidatus Limnocylindria bacterium]
MKLIDCREAVARMWAYLSEGLETTDVDELETHLGVCQRCCGELEFSRQLRQRVAEAEVAQMPSPVRERIVELIERDARPGDSR